jgi:hypothetical protein
VAEAWYISSFEEGSLNGWGMLQEDIKLGNVRERARVVGMLQEGFRADIAQVGKVQEAIRAHITQEGKLQEEKLQEDKLQEGKLQEEKLQDDKLQEDKLQEGMPEEVIDVEIAQEIGRRWGEDLGLG